VLNCLYYDSQKKKSTIPDLLCNTAFLAYPTCQYGKKPSTFRRLSASTSAFTESNAYRPSINQDKLDRSVYSIAFSYTQTHFISLVYASTILVFRTWNGYASYQYNSIYSLLLFLHFMLQAVRPLPISYTYFISSKALLISTVGVCCRICFDFFSLSQFVFLYTDYFQLSPSYYRSSHGPV
jgi:hypothetical protein